MKNLQNTTQFKNTILTVWFAMLMSSFTLAGVIFTLKFSPILISEMQIGNSDQVVFEAAAVLAFLVSFALLGHFRKQSLLNGKIVDQKKLQLGYLLAWALSEGVTLIGLVNGMMKNSNVFLPYFALGLIAMVAHFPKELFAKEQV